MTEATEDSDRRGLIAIIGIPALFASMCCLPSVVLVLFGLSTVTAAASLSDQLYWGLDGWSWFRPTLLILSAIMLIFGIVIYLRNRGICTLDDAVRNRRKVVNTILLVSVSSYLLYLLFNYVILTEIGILLGLPWESSRVWNK
ncbi:MAG: hypothetical protein QGH13_07055 [Candidatus Thalassarchaeaceae archaeon]|jgi:hypothetical protein|nr:hypothetical protein [Candidatus Thalassarchaeaceae archaeon]